MTIAQGYLPEAMQGFDLACQKDFLLSMGSESECSKLVMGLAATAIEHMPPGFTVPAITATLTTSLGPGETRTTSTHTSTTTTAVCNGSADPNECDPLSADQCNASEGVGPALRQLCPVLCDSCEANTCTMSCTHEESTTIAPRDCKTSLPGINCNFTTETYNEITQECVANVVNNQSLQCISVAATDMCFEANAYPELQVYEMYVVRISSTGICKSTSELISNIHCDDNNIVYWANQEAIQDGKVAQGGLMAHIFNDNSNFIGNLLGPSFSEARVEMHYDQNQLHAESRIPHKLIFVGPKTGCEDFAKGLSVILSKRIDITTVR
jgi:hypothetical protein